MWTKQITGKNNNISSFLFSSTRHTWRACSRAWQLRHLCSFCNGHHVSYFGPSICNSLPPHIRNATTINAFNHLLNLISSTSQSHLTSPIPIWCVWVSISGLLLFVAEATVQQRWRPDQPEVRTPGLWSACSCHWQVSSEEPGAPIDRHTDIQTHTHLQTHTHTYRHRHRHIDTPADRHTDI